jgi:hypothetical protein
MKQGMSQQAGLRQELRINPRLYQAMDMLYMPMMDLQQHLKQELLVNPFLELVEPAEEEQEAEAPTAEQEKEKAEKEEEIDWENPPQRLRRGRCQAAVRGAGLPQADRGRVGGPHRSSPGTAQPAPAQPPSEALWARNFSATSVTTAISPRRSGEC